MKRNSKRFLALFMAVSMSVTPTTVLHAEENSETDQIQNVEIKQDENIAQEDSEKNEKSNSAENLKEEIGKNEQAEVKDTQDNVPVKEEPVSDNTNQENVQENGNQNITSNVEKNDNTNQENQEKESPEQEAAVPEFKAEKVEAVVVNGKIQVTVSTKDENYDQIYIGKKEDSEKTPEVKGEKNDLGGYDFVFEAEAGNLGQKLQYVPHLTEKNEWYSEKDMFLDMPAEAQFPELAASVNEVAGANLLSAGEVQSKEVAAGHKTVELIDGASYKVTAETGADMFKVVDCTLVSTKDKEMEAVITLSRQGYDYLYMGRAEEAAKADKSLWVPFKEDNNGKYTYTVPLESLDKEIAVAAFSHNRQSWYGRTLVFHSDSLEKIGDISNEGNGGTNGGSTTPSGSNNGSILKPNDGKAENESKYEADTSGATSKVNSSTVLADGVYTPDRFTWSGGTGKVKIYCNKITIQNGQAYATLVFDSDHYQYVKANGNKYYTTKGGGSATAVIPVALNQNNKIIGMTDKMSVAHEIEYTIFIYLAAANGGTSANGTVASTNSNQKLDEQAPEIIGLEYQSETKLDYAEYFKIYHYDQGIVLLEIDMTKDTARDPEKAEETKSENEKSAEDTEKSSKKKVASVTINRSEDSKNSDAESKVDASAEESAASDNNGTSEQELAAELYKGNVVKYLIVPEDVEVPVGLEQDMIIVKKPVDHTYAESDEILNTMKDLDLLDNVAAVGMKSKDCTVSEIADKMKAKDGEKNAEVAYAGTADKLKLKNLVKSEVNLALFTGDILPREDSEENVAKDIDKIADKDSKDTKETLTVEEKTEQFEELTEKLAMLGIPVLVDRSSEEKTELGKQEWIKVYGVLYGCEELTNEKFDAAVAAAEK